MKPPPTQIPSPRVIYAAAHLAHTEEGAGRTTAGQKQRFGTSFAVERGSNVAHDLIAKMGIHPGSRGPAASLLFQLPLFLYWLPHPLSATPTTRGLQELACTGTEPLQG